jgi:hypothetical protein
MGALAAALVLASAACSSNGLGDVLGGVLNAPGAQQVSGNVQGVDTRSEMVFIRQNDGSSLGVRYDSRTEVVYQNRTYSVTSLENGDQVTARIVDNGNGNYYTDYIQVNSSVSDDGGYGNDAGAVYNLSGTIRQIDSYNGVFTMDTQNQGRITVSMPYNPRSTDVTRFRNLRSGDYVQLQALQLNSGRYELRQFY